MNSKRAIAAGILLYVSTFILFAIFRFIAGIESTTYAVPLRWYIIFWIAYIPLTLGWAKWYFRKQAPSPRAGLLLGIIAIFVAFCIEGIGVIGTLLAGQSLDVFKTLYTDWKFFLTILWVLALCIFAGWEFDATYTESKE